eukprot:13576196-Alexandrium_andersonii.AAC.1
MNTSAPFRNRLQTTPTPPRTRPGNSKLEQRRPRNVLRTGARSSRRARSAQLFALTAFPAD